MSSDIIRFDSNHFHRFERTFRSIRLLFIVTATNVVSVKIVGRALAGWMADWLVGWLNRASAFVEISVSDTSNTMENMCVFTI